MHKFSLAVILFCFTFTLESACVKTQWANLKEGPGLQFDTKWVVPKNTPLKIIKKKANWYLVEEVDRVRSWVNAQKLTNSYFCGIVKWEQTRLLDKSFKKRQTAFYDQAFKILKIKQNKWAWVKNQYGSEGWVKKRSLWVH